MSNNNTTPRSSIDNNIYGARLNQTSLKSEHADAPPLLIATNNISYSRPLARERPYARNETANSSNSSSRPPSIRSATSFGRPLGRFVTGQHARHQSTYSNFSTMSETALPWTTKDIGFNAISGVLNDPAKPKDLTKPSKGDIPPVTHASISRIKPSNFEAYLNHIGPAFERYHYNKLQNPPHHNNPNTEIAEEEEAALISPQFPFGKHQPRRTTRNPYSLPQHILSSESLLDDDESSKTPPRDLPMLENVPSIFFEPDFLLENPQVFDTVCEGADIVGNTGPNPPTSTNSILQEKLSYYLDTVEVHLLREIENRSSSFFEALSNLQALHQQTLDCVSQIHTIRQKMKQIQDTECKDGLEIIRLQVRKRNLEKLYRVTKTVRDIRATQPMIQALLGKGDYFAALDLIEETKLVLNNNRKSQSQDDEVDLSSIKALANFSAQLDEMQKAVGVMTQHDFLSTLLSDFTFILENIDLERAKQSLLNTNAQVMQPDLQKEKDLRDKLRPIVMGLLRTEMLLSTLREYREQLMIEIKDIIRKRYPASVLSQSTISSQEEQINSQLSKQLKAMPFSAFFDMLLDMFSALMKAIERTSIYHQLIASIASDQPEIEKESADILFSVADLAHVRCGKLIGFRNDQNALLNPTDFYRFSNVIRTFVVQCESMCKRTCFGLRGTMTTQQKAFIEHFHMERVKQEAQLIENEQWVASEVPSDFQSIVDNICDGHIASHLNELTSRSSQKGEKPTKHLVLDGYSFYVVGCSLLILKMFEDYLKCALNLDNPTLTIEIVHRLIEMLKLFNSRVCQVILGAGAMRSAGLKNITAKHLALASQSLAVMITLIPKLKHYVAHQLLTKSLSDPLLSEFDHAVEDYRNHQGEIHSKLVAIMNERFAAHAKAMQAIDWDQEAMETGKHANIYMETLVTETVRLHKVLSKYLPERDLKSVMSQVFQSFTTRLSVQITNTVIKTEKGKERLKRDVLFFNDRLRSLPQVDPPSHATIEAMDTLVVQDKA
ncbi:Vacuolar protein sorting-associated protein 54 [Choanephora cucurbitarum]|uniref:Vacuolar protein sorting-associated protein 54 n=1 Tax=Choanephora cucurbitarum TaxID=101091 RepID=A0A1C7NND0_9FUNG|nr:Vacuolar protein sorting-associated protein 54 [Choanephora cucurbitarum]